MITNASAIMTTQTLFNFELNRRPDLARKYGYFKVIEPKTTIHNDEKRLSYIECEMSRRPRAAFRMKCIKNKYSLIINACHYKHSHCIRR